MFSDTLPFTPVLKMRNMKSLLFYFLVTSAPVEAFAPYRISNDLSRLTTTRQNSTRRHAKPRRLEENAPGVVYVNDRVRDALLDVTVSVVSFLIASFSFCSDCQY